MRRFWWAFLLIAGCSAGTETPIASPEGRYVATADVPEGTGRVRLKVVEGATGREMVFSTRASHYSKWAPAWSPTGALVLWSSDIGTYAYDIADGRMTERPAVGPEIESAREAYRGKYHKEPPGRRP